MAINPKNLEKWPEENSNVLLEKLLSNISENYWLKLDSLKKLVEVESKEWMIWLKEQITKIKDSSEKEVLYKLSNKNLEELFFALKWAKETISRLSEENIEGLRQEIESSWSYPENYAYLSDKCLPESLIASAKNPENVSEHILWAFLWTINSTEKILKISLDLLIWIWKWIYDLWLIISWKWAYDISKKV